MSEPSCYLVTGATGVVGSAFVERVLTETADSLLLVIRSRSNVAPTARLDALFRFWDLGTLERAARARVRVLAGDTEAPRLGLSTEDWALATTTATHAVHAAAIVKMNLPIDEARRAAVSSMQGVLAFAADAAQHRLRKVDLVSTVGIGGRRSEPLEEDWLETPRAFHNTYEEAKADAERVAHRALANGVPLTVLRPSMVVGDSRSGKAIAPQIFSYLCEFLTGTRVHGLFPPLTNARLDVVPVDWVSRLLLTSSRMPDWVGRVLHACSAEASVSLVHLRERVQRLASAQGRRVLHRATLPLEAFRKASSLGRLVGSSRARKASALLDILLAYLEDEQRFENRRTLALAAEAGLTFPRPEGYLDTVVRECFLQRGAPSSLPRGARAKARI